MDVRIDSWAWIRRDQLDPVKADALKQKLTILPRKVGDHPGDAPAPIYLYEETDTELGVAREFFLNYRKDHNVTLDVCDGAAWPGDVELKATLRDEQKLALDTIVARFKSGTLGGILRAAPGWGKTTWACALIAALRVPTLVVVHKEFLMTQWRKRFHGDPAKDIKAVLPDAKIGLVQGPTCDFEGKHVVLAMVQSLVQKGYPEALYRWPGLVITDEVHRIGSATWSAVPPKFPARYRIGLSATPRRKDGADNVFKYHIGDMLFSGREQRLKPKVRKVWTTFSLVQTERFNPNLAPKSLILRFLCKSEKRNRQVVEQLIKAVGAGRKVLVLSERLEHLRALETMLLQTWAKTVGTQAPETGYYVGGMREAELEDSEQKTVIFATSQMVSEGLDIPALDTLFLTTPLSDIEQATGRIQRPSPGKKDPVVVDFIDDKVVLCRRLAEMRDKQYQRIAA